MGAKRCPMCHQANEELDWQCRRCAYEFGQPVERVRELLRDQITSARIIFWILLVLLLAVLAIPAYLAYLGSRIVFVPGVLTLFFLMRSTIRARQRIRISHESLRSLDRQQAELPKATVRSS
jgi:hypothetical protein